MVIFGNSDDRPEDDLEDGQIKENPGEDAGADSKTIKEQNPDEDAGANSETIKEQNPDEDAGANSDSKQSEDIENIKSKVQEMSSEISKFEEENRELKDENEDLREKISQMMSMYDGFLSDMNPAMESLEDNSRADKETEEQADAETSVEKDAIRMNWMDDIVSEYDAQTALRVLYYYNKKGDISKEEKHRTEGILQLHPLYDDSSDSSELNERDELDPSVKDLSEEYLIELD